MNFTITDKNGNKRTIELTEDKEKLGGVEDKLVIIKDGKKYYAPLVEKAEEKYPRMYVIKKDGIKRYVGEIQKIPNDTIEKNNWIGNYLKRKLLWTFKVPDGITMLKLYIEEDFFIKVRPLQEIAITGHARLASSEGDMVASYYVNQHRVRRCSKQPISISFSKEINSYSGEDILDISNEENQREFIE